MKLKRLCRACGRPFVARSALVYCSAKCGNDSRAAAAVVAAAVAELVAKSRAAAAIRLSLTGQRMSAAGNVPIPALPVAEQQRRASARWAVKYALQKGILSRGRCEQDGPDCSGAVEAHHDDYDEPLQVRWLCVKHHRIEDGPKMRRFAKCNEGATKARLAPDARNRARNSLSGFMLTN